MEHFIFKGIKSSDKNIVIEKMPSLVKPQRDVQTIKIPGRNGSFHVDNGTYDSVIETIECILLPPYDLNEIKSWLNGSGVIEFSTNPGIEYDAWIINKIPFDRYIADLKSFPIQIELQPIGRGKIQQHVNITESNHTFEINGNVEVSPLVVVNGTGDFQITINNVSINLAGVVDSISVDCDLMNVTENNGLNNANTKINADKFPTLGHSNTVTFVVASGTLASIDIYYKERWL